MSAQFIYTMRKVRKAVGDKLASGMTDAGSVSEAAVAQAVQQLASSRDALPESLKGSFDSVARQYADGFREVFDEGVPVLRASLARTAWLETAIVGCHLHLMAKFPDALIVRKRGQAEAEESASRS